MTSSRIRVRVHAPVAALVAVVLLGAAPAAADLRKLDPRARLAYQGLRTGTDASVLRAEGFALSPAGALDVFIVGSVTRAELESAGAHVRTALPGVYTADLPLAAVVAVADLPGVRVIEASRPVHEMTNVSVPTTGANLLRGPGPDFVGLNGQGVLVGIIDSGVDWRSDDFRNPDGTTRLLGYWDEIDASGRPPSVVSGLPLAYGSEWTEADIDHALAGGTPVPQRDPHLHGSICLGIAAGDGSAFNSQSPPPFTYVGMAPRARLILGRAALDGSDYTTTSVIDAASYVVGRAGQLGLPCVVNVSLGDDGGAHDGTTPEAIAFDALSGPGRVFVLAAGNDGPTGWHARLVAGTANNSCVLNSTVITTGTDHHYTLNGFYEASDDLNVIMTAPDGTIVGPVTLGNAITAATPSGTLYLENGISSTINGTRLVYVQMDADATQSPAGNWRITFTPVTLGPRNGLVDVWRATSLRLPSSFTVGRNDSMLISSMATGFRTLSVGGWVAKNAWTACNGPQLSPAAIGSPYSLTSAGPTRDQRRRPTLAAPADNVASTCSQDPGPPVCTSGILPGRLHMISSGTSLAVPHVVGAVALLMQKFGAVTPEFAESLLIHRANNSAPGTWSFKTGWGKLFLGDLTDPLAHVVTANGGEVLGIGTVTTLRWTASDDVGVTAVDLRVSRSGPTGPWEALATGIANSGAWDWTVSGPAAPGCWLQVVAHDAIGNTGGDISDQPFAIVDVSTPTLLDVFEGAPVADGIELRWRLADAARFSAVDVERSTVEGGLWRSASVERHDESGVAAALDRNVSEGTRYLYRLRANDGGTTLTLGQLEVTAGASVHAFELGPPRPNPSSGVVRVAFALPHPAPVDLAVYDAMGRRVATLAHGLVAAGRQQAVWDGSASGAHVPAGLYFVRLSAPGVLRTRRVVVGPGASR